MTEMTNEEMQQKIEFIIEQQAQFTTDIQLLKEAQSRLTAKVDTLAEIQANSEIRLGRVEESFILLVQLAKLTDDRLDTLTQSMTILTEAQARTDTKLAELAEAETHTEERLNTLINVVERYISKSSNGNSQS
jgi:hypothetical protein